MAAIDKIYCTHKEWVEIYEPEVQRLNPIFQEFFHTSETLSEYICWRYEEYVDDEEYPICNLPTKIDIFLMKNSDIFTQKLLSWNYTGYKTVDEALEDMCIDLVDFPDKKPKVRCIQYQPFVPGWYDIIPEYESYIQFVEDKPNSFWEYMDRPYQYKRLGDGWISSFYCDEFKSKKALIRNFRNKYPVPGTYYAKNFNGFVIFKLLVYPTK